MRSRSPRRRSFSHSFRTISGRRKSEPVCAVCSMDICTRLRMHSPREKCTRSLPLSLSLSCNFRCKCLESILCAHDCNLFCGCLLDEMIFFLASGTKIRLNLNAIARNRIRIRRATTDRPKLWVSKMFCEPAAAAADGMAQKYGQSNRVVQMGCIATRDALHSTSLPHRF